MENQLYNSYMKYFKSLCAFGNIPIDAVYKLMAKQFIYDTFNKCNVNYNDIEYINKALKCIEGSSCLTPFGESTSVAHLNNTCRG